MQKKADIVNNTLEKQYTEKLKTLEAYRTAVNEAAIVSITDTAGRILYINDKFIEISKYTASELIGQNHRVINSGHHSPKFFKEMWQTISKGKHWRGEIKNRAKDGSYYWVDTVITPLLDDNNGAFQYLSVRNLITVQKEHEEKLIRLQQALIKREQQLKDAQEVAKTGSWHIDITSNSLEWSEEAYNIFDIPVGTPMTYELFLEKVHPDDRCRISKDWQDALIKRFYDTEHRVITTFGEKWVRERARFEFNSSSVITGAVGTIQDITEKKKTENKLKESEALYKNLFNNSPFAIGIFDKETLQLLEVNEAAIKLYGYSKEELLQLTVYDFRIIEEHEALKKQLEKGNFAGDNTIRLHKKKNSEIIYVEPLITEISYKGQQAFLISINDMTEKVKMQEQLIDSKITQQKEVSRAYMEAQEKNRVEIGRELHDNINQLLVASNLYMRNIKPDSEKDRELVEKSISITVSAINEIRKLSSSLVPPSLNDKSLKESIENLSLNFELTRTVIEFDIKINEDAMTEGLKINIYRIIQEQFNNIIKYAEATKAKLILTQDNNLVTVELYDNGKGFDQKQKPKGIGLSNIIRRAETYNGKASIVSSPGNGCKVYVEFAL